MMHFFPQKKTLLAFSMISFVLPFGGSSPLITITQTGPAVAPAVSMPTAVESPVGVDTSLNWSGYEATGGTFTAVAGTWIVPQVPAASSTEADATWVGIGGIESRDLIQAGTQAVADRSGGVQYEAWYETLPQTTHAIPVGIAPGNSVSASLTEVSAGTWLFTFRNNTTGMSYQTDISYNSSLSSAEWIEEMPSDGTGLISLDNFGSVSFTGGTTTKNGTPVSIQSSGAQPVSMINNARQVIAAPSSLGADGESFMVTRSTVPTATAFATAPTMTVSSAGGGWRRYVPTAHSRTVYVNGTGYRIFFRL